MLAQHFCVPRRWGPWIDPMSLLITGSAGKWSGKPRSTAAVLASAPASISVAR